MRLEDISEILIGVLLNREIRKDGEIKYKLFNLKSYEEKEEYMEFPTNKTFTEKLTKEGDLLFRLVSPNKIVYIEKDQENLLVPSQLCIIRPQKQIINPIYLKWYLENSPGKEKVMLELTGSSIQKISVNSLRSIDVPVIDMEKQKAIEDLIKLWNKEKEVMNQIISNKELLYTNLIQEIVQGGE